MSGSRNRCNLNGELFVAPVCVLSIPHTVPGDADGKYGHSAATDRSWPRCGHMVTSVTRSNHFSGTDSQGGDELDQTVNCSKATYRRPLYLRGYTERTVDDTMEGLFLCT